MIYPASEREQSVFTYWLEKRMIRKGVTAMAFMRLCDNGKVPGFAPDDWPVSDTVTGSDPDAGDGEQRDERFLQPIPGNVTARPGPSTMQEASTVSR